LRHAPHRHQIDGQHANTDNIIKLLIGSDVPGVLEWRGWRCCLLLASDALTSACIRGNSQPCAHEIRQHCVDQVSTRQQGDDNFARARLHGRPGRQETHVRALVSRRLLSTLLARGACDGVIVCASALDSCPSIRHTQRGTRRLTLEANGAAAQRPRTW